MTAQTLMERIAALEARVAQLEAEREPWSPTEEAAPPAFTDTFRPANCEVGHHE